MDGWMDRMICSNGSTTSCPSRIPALCNIVWNDAMEDGFVIGSFHTQLKKVATCCLEKEQNEKEIGLDGWIVKRWRERGMHWFIFCGKERGNEGRDMREIEKKGKGRAEERKEDEYHSATKEIRLIHLSIIGTSKRKDAWNIECACAWRKYREKSQKSWTKWSLRWPELHIDVSNCCVKQDLGGGREESGHGKSKEDSEIKEKEKKEGENGQSRESGREKE